MKLARKLTDIYTVTLEEVEQIHKNWGWCFGVSDGKLITITIEK